MAVLTTITQLKAKIDLYIKTNGAKSITGVLDNEIRNDVVDTLNAQNLHFFYQSATPTGIAVGDIWYDSTNKTINRYSGVTWVKLILEYSIFSTPTLAEAERSVEGNVCYVVSTKTIYQYLTLGSAYTDDNKFILSTGDGGDTRWIGISGQYIVGNLNVQGNTELDGSVIVNQSGEDKDFRVEGSTDADLLTTDAGNDRVGIGTNTPSTKLEVNGEVRLTASSDMGTDDASLATKKYVDDNSASIFEITDFTATPTSNNGIALTSDLRDSINKYDALMYKQTRSIWAISTTYNLDDIIIPLTSSKYSYICTVGGTSASAEISWATSLGESITDNTITWKSIPRYDYGIVKTITNTAILIVGNRLVFSGGNIEELYYIPFSKILINDYYLTSASFADSSNIDILDTEEKQYRFQPKHLMVAMMAKCHTNDTTTNSTIVVNDGTNDVFSSDVAFATSKVETWSDGTIDQKYSLLEAGYVVLNTDNTGDGDTDGAYFVTFGIPLKLIK